MVKVAINGFGRIGRMSFRAMMDHPELDIVAVNDLTNADTLAYLFKYDSVHDNFEGEVHAEGDCIVVNGKKVKIYAERDPQNLPWKELGVDIVGESTGLFKKRDQMMKHIAAGAKKVILTVPASKAEDVDATVVMGVNDNVLTKEMQLVSKASCTPNCLTCATPHARLESSSRETFLLASHATAWKRGRNHTCST
jgi:glyceraldehyde 3-phosphate dehydrogenase